MQLLEEKIIRIVEECGYMGTKYIPVIKQIVLYCQEYIKHNASSNNTWEFDVPIELTDKIDCVENLLIKIIIRDTENGKYRTGSGENRVFYSNQIVNGKLEYGHIIIDGYSYQQNLFPRTIFNPLSHELNHLQEIYQRMLKRDNAQTIFQRCSDDVAANTATISTDSEINTFLQTIFYRLLTKSEFNALINGVYGDLEGMESERKNFKRDLMLTQAYFIHNFIKEKMSLLDKLSNEEWQNIIKSFNMLSADGAKHKVNVTSFKKSFKQIVIQRLNDLMKGIGKIASYYYDRKEINNEKKVLRMKDPDMEIK